MPEKIIVERLNAILDHIETIELRMAGIKRAKDFTSPQGSVLFDAILIRLQALGENIKKIESYQPGFVDHQLSIDVDKIIRFRDIISHHYEKLDSEIIFDIVKHQIPILKEAVTAHLQQSKPLKQTATKLLEKKEAKSPD